MNLNSDPNTLWIYVRTWTTIRYVYRTYICICRTHKATNTLRLFIRLIFFPSSVSFLEFFFCLRPTYTNECERMARNNVVLIRQFSTSMHAYPLHKKILRTFYYYDPVIVIKEMKIVCWLGVLFMFWIWVFLIKIDFFLLHSTVKMNVGVRHLFWMSWQK